MVVATAWAGLAASEPQSSSNNESKTCGPPQYCARTDRKTDPYPDQPPAIGPAGSIITDPTFGSRILRVTDGKSDPKVGDRSLVTPSSAEQNTFSKDTRMFYVTTLGGSFLLYDFDPATMKARPAKTPNVTWGAEPQFSFSQPNVLYGVNRRTALIEQYDTSSGKVSTVYDPSKCVKMEGKDSAFAITVSADDNRSMVVVGPQQDKNRMVLIHDRTQGCRWFNTETGEIGGQWGPTGTVAVSDRFSIHNARMAKSGKYVYITRGGAGTPGHWWVAWEIDTMNVTVCAKACRGHHVSGYSHIIGPSGFVHPMDLLERPLSNIDKSTSLISGLEPNHKFWFDSHYSWNNVDPDDTAPVCFSTYQPTNPETPGAPPQVTGPWENEIDCAETDGKGSKIWRFAHTYSTARNGFWSSPRGNVSQDGRFYMFTSDWEDQLGKSNEGKYRTDVFIVELK